MSLYVRLLVMDAVDLDLEGVPSANQGIMSYLVYVTTFVLLGTLFRPVLAILTPFLMVLFLTFSSAILMI